MRSGNERWPTFFRNRFTLHFFLATRGALRRRSYFLIGARNTERTGTATAQTNFFQKRSFTGRQIKFNKKLFPKQKTIKAFNIDT